MNPVDCEDNEIMFRANVLKRMSENIGLPGQLNIIAKMYGVRRRWFGFESDAALRKRVREVILSGGRK